MTLVDARNSASEQREGSVIPRPPSHVGNAIRFLMISYFGADRPVIDGMNSEQIVSSKAWIHIISGVVCEIHNRLLAMPWV